MEFFKAQLDHKTVGLAQGFGAVCAFVNDNLDKSVLETLNQSGVRIIAMRCAGFNNVDLEAAESLGMTVVRVPTYSPYAVAEHALTLIMSLNRRIHRAYNRVREGNFELKGLLGEDIHGQTVGIIGTGAIGTVFAKLMTGFGCELLAYDPYPNDEVKALGVTYVSLDELLQRSSIISIHCPLTPETRHLINADTIALMRDGVILVNTSRGGIIDTRAAVDGLKSGKIGQLGLDVYEAESDLFFKDLSNRVIQDDLFTRLLTFPNVIITGHQAFFTETALSNIAQTTLENVRMVERGEECPNVVKAKPLAKA
jgi:D-lactate dehydrogenase